MNALQKAHDLIANAPTLAQHTYVNTYWRPGDTLPAGTCFCTMGAVAVAKDIPLQQIPYDEDVLALARGINPNVQPDHPDNSLDDNGPFQTISEWNDAEGRTREDVLALFDKVINNGQA